MARTAAKTTATAAKRRKSAKATKQPAAGSPRSKRSKRRPPATKAADLGELAEGLFAKPPRRRTKKVPTNRELRELRAAADESQPDTDGKPWTEQKLAEVEDAATALLEAAESLALPPIENPPMALDQLLAEAPPPPAQAPVAERPADPTSAAPQPDAQVNDAQPDDVMRESAEPTAAVQVAPDEDLFTAMEAASAGSEDWADVAQAEFAEAPARPRAAEPEPEPEPEPEAASTPRARPAAQEIDDDAAPAEDETWRIPPGPAAVDISVLQAVVPVAARVDELVPRVRELGQDVQVCRAKQAGLAGTVGEMGQALDAIRASARRDRALLEEAQGVVYAGDLRWVLGGMAVLMLCWSVATYFKTGDAKLAFWLLLAGNALGCGAVAYGRTDG